jgi:hypothetical protein
MSRTDLPVGQISGIHVQPFRKKYFACAVGQIAATSFSRLASERGVRAIATDVGCGMRWTCWCRKASDADTDGKVAWSWRPDAGVKFADD